MQTIWNVSLNPNADELFFTWHPYLPGSQQSTKQATERSAAESVACEYMCICIIYISQYIYIYAGIEGEKERKKEYEYI